MNLKRINDKEVFILAIDVIRAEFQYININKSTDIQYIKFHKPYGGKPAYEITINENKFKKFDCLYRETLNLVE